MMNKMIIFLSFVYITSFSWSQDTKTFIFEDSLFTEIEQEAALFQEISTLNPKKAALLSTLVPGLGQIYNKDYWKVPIIWGGLLAFTHIINQSNNLYHGLRNATLLESKGLINPYQSRISNESTLIRNRDRFRRTRDYIIIIGTIFYILNIVEAHVAAHLNEFKVNERLSLEINPSIKSYPSFSPQAGVSLALKF